jgi:hypothetical protein
MYHRRRRKPLRRCLLLCLPRFLWSRLSTPRAKRPAHDQMSEAHRARLSVRFFLDRLRVQVAAFEGARFPGHDDGPRTWIKLAAGILDTADNYLDKAEISDPAGSTKLTRDAAALCSIAYDHLSHLLGATIEDIPWAVVPPLKRWFDELGIQNDVFFRAELKRNYEISSFEQKDFARIRDAAPSLADVISKAKWPILRVTVPSASLSILPHFAIVAHSRTEFPCDQIKRRTGPSSALFGLSRLQFRSSNVLATVDKLS